MLQRWIPIFCIATLGVLRGFGCFYWVQWIDHPGIHQIISPTLYSWGSPLLDPKNGQQNLTPGTLGFPNRNEGVANSKNTPDTQPPPGSYKRYTQEDVFVGPDHLKNTPERKGKSSVPRPVILRFELLIFRGVPSQKKTNNELIPLIQKVWIRYPGWLGPGFCSI